MPTFLPPKFCKNFFWPSTSLLCNWFSHEGKCIYIKLDSMFFWSHGGLGSGSSSAMIGSEMAAPDCTKPSHPTVLSGLSHYLHFWKPSNIVASVLISSASTQTRLFPTILSPTPSCTILYYTYRQNCSNQL